MCKLDYKRQIDYYIYILPFRGLYLYTTSEYSFRYCSRQFVQASSPDPIRIFTKLFHACRTLQAPADVLHWCSSGDSRHFWPKDWSNIFGQIFGTVSQSEKNLKYKILINTLAMELNCNEKIDSSFQDFCKHQNIAQN